MDVGCGFFIAVEVGSKLHLGLLSKKNIFAHPLHNNNFTSPVIN